ncbi:MAG: hypothetical protein JXR25_11470 [Pontiellaceae bacterium]|nr:hypothetical protein [Pontiellaceae bacterium]MBN2785433.1 hypothetical protein [Pontiellaceae bacterium]
MSAASLLAMFCHGKVKFNQMELVRIPSYRLQSWQVSDGLPFNQIQDVIQRENGFIWVATLNGPARFDGAQFEVFNMQTAGLPDNRVMKLAEDRAGNLFLGHETGRISVRIGNRFYEITGAEEYVNDSIDRFVLCSDESLWAVFKNGNRMPVSRDGQPVMRPVPESEWPVFDPLPGPANGWTERDGDVVQVLDGEVVRRWGSVPWDVTQDIRFLELSNGDVVAGMTYGGVWIMHPDHTVTRLDRGVGLLSHTVLSLAEDREHTLWLGTKSGLQSFRYDRYSGYIIGNAFTRPVSICARDNRIWMGSNDESLWRVEGGEFFQLARPSALARSIFAVYEDDAEIVWSDLDRQFLLRVDSAGYRNVLPMNKQVDHIWAFLEDDDGTLWAGGEQGLWKKQPEVRWQSVEFPDASLSRIRCLEHGPGNTIWIGMETGGIAVWDGTDCRVLGEESGLPRIYVSALLPDSDGQGMWVGTCGGGLYRYAGSRFRRIPLEQHVITQMLRDDYDRLWLLTEAGIAVVEEELLRRAPTVAADPVAPILIDRSEGVSPTLDFESSLHTMCRKKDGTIGVICENELLMFDPAKILRSEEPVTLSIHEMVVNDGRREVSGVDELEVGPGVHRLDIRFSALNYVSSERIRFKCRMVGQEEDWRQLGNRREANFQHLSPGTYRFELLAANRDGRWNAEPEVIRIHVLPFFWQRPWFRFFLYGGSLLIAVLLALAIADRLNRRKLILAEMQKAVEEERTRIAMDIHDEMGSQMTRISLLCDQFSMAFRNQDWTHAPRHLVELDRVSGKLVRSLDEIVWVVRPRNDTLRSLLGYLGKFAAGFMEEAGIECDLDMPISVPDCMISGPVRHNVFLCVKEALNNVVKHASASRVIFSAQVKNCSVYLTIEDDGCGLPEDDDAEFKRGLESMARRMRMAGGRFQAKNGEAGGTKIEIELAT